MKREKLNFLAGLFFIALTLFQIAQFSHDASGNVIESERCWPTPQVKEDALSDYSEILRSYSCPPAWEEPEDSQRSPLIPQVLIT